MDTNSNPKTWKPKCSLVIGDCLEKMKEIPDESVDLVLTDPPYGIGAANYTRANTQWGKSLARCKDYGLNDWDKESPKQEFFEEIFRISKNQIIFGGNYFNLKPSSCWIVWDKDNSDNNYADCELAWTSFDSAVRRVKWKWHGMLQENMRHKDVRFHPTQKPVGVMQWIVKNYSEVGNLICDPFMGSGTTGVAALKLGRRFIGIEINPDYFEIAKQRIKPWLEQQRLGVIK